MQEKNIVVGDQDLVLCETSCSSNIDSKKEENEEQGLGGVNYDTCVKPKIFHLLSIKASVFLQEKARLQ